MRILLATNNQGKYERFKELIHEVDPTFELLTPKMLGIEVRDIEETGKTLAENAEMKAWAYQGYIDMPIVANDTGFFVEGEGFVLAPKRAAFGNGDESGFTPEEKASKLVEFWKGIATKHGGRVDATWIEVFACLMPDGTLKTSESKREVVLTNEEFGTAHIQMPVRALYISKATGKPAISHTHEEEVAEMQPVIEALAKILK